MSPVPAQAWQGSCEPRAGADHSGSYQRASRCATSRSRSAARVTRELAPAKPCSSRYLFADRRRATAWVACGVPCRMVAGPCGTRRAAGNTQTHSMRHVRMHRAIVRSQQGAQRQVSCRTKAAAADRHRRAGKGCSLAARARRPCVCVRARVCVCVCVRARARAEGRDPSPSSVAAVASSAANDGAARPEPFRRSDRSRRTIAACRPTSRRPGGLLPVTHTASGRGNRAAAVAGDAPRRRADAAQPSQRKQAPRIMQPAARAIGLCTACPRGLGRRLEARPL